MKNKRVKKLTGIAILSASTVVLALISNYVTIGTVNLNLALIPIVVGSCIYGVSAGLFLGIVDGILVCTAPSTLSFFMTHNAFLTIVLCLVKTGLGGALCGVVYNLLKKKNEYVSVLLSSITLPIVNTGIFLLGVFLFFIPPYEKIMGEGDNVISFILYSTLTINFLIEFILNILLSSTIYRVIKLKSK